MTRGCYSVRVKPGWLQEVSHPSLPILVRVSETEAKKRIPVVLVSNQTHLPSGRLMAYGLVKRTGTLVLQLRNRQDHERETELTLRIPLHRASHNKALSKSRSLCPHWPASIACPNELVRSGLECTRRSGELLLTRSTIGFSDD
jgi:hypothetical protein